MDASGAHELALELAKQRAWLQALARSLVGASDADDLAQATLVVALERPPDRARDLRSWLSGIARNLARDRWRARARHAAPARARELEPSSDSAADVVERVDSEQRIAREVLALPEPLRTVLLLRYHEGLTSAEIATRERLPEGTVRSRIRAGLEELRGRLQKEFGGERALAVVLLDLARWPGTTSIAGGAGVAVAAWAWLAAVVGIAACLFVALRAAPWSAESGPQSVSTPRSSSAHVAPNAEAAEERDPNSVASDPTRRTPLDASIATATARFLVREWDGAPVVEQRAWLVDTTRNEVLESARTDSRGRVAFTAGTGTRTLVLERRHAFPTRVEVELAPGERTIDLARGRVVEGRVTVRGHPPDEPLALELWPRGAFDALDEHDPMPFGDRACATTAPDGSFRFHGAGAGEHDLVAPLGYFLEGTVPEYGGAVRTVVSAPHDESALEFSLERLRRVRGRVVADGAAVQEAEVRLDVVLVAGDHGLGTVRTDARGAFVLHVAGEPARVNVSFGRKGHEAEDGRLERHWPSETEELDLGELVIGGARNVVFRVREPGGAAIEGATVRGVGVTNARGEAGDRELGLAVSEVLVRAWGYQPRNARLSATPPAPVLGGLEVVDVVLEPTTLLRLTVRGADRALVSGARVQLVSETALPKDPARLFGAWLDRGPGEARHRGIQAFEGGFSIELATGTKGTACFDGLEIGAPYRLAVLDDLGRVVLSEVVRFASATERRELEFVLPDALLRFGGRVLGPDGRGLSAATIEATAEPAPGAEHEPAATGVVETGRDGSFQFERLVPGPIRVSVRANGFVPLELASFVPGATRPDFVLEPGRDVVLRVVDAAGALVAEGALEVHVDGRRLAVACAPVAAGIWRLSGLEPRPCTAHLELAGRSFETRVESDAREVELRVPQSGACDVEWELEPAETRREIRLRLEPVDRTGGAVEGSSIGRAAGTLRIATVLPGLYDVTLVQAPVPGVVAGDRRLAGPVRVTIEAGRTAHVRFVR
ncbi:MAG: sigma-70 family RNA polymerase sigma factor [Planctomycetes bacterium]|nr:sigma-70 family RNA polymerase sigma factor [Planctomycetota bacterium]